MAFGRSFVAVLPLLLAIDLLLSLLQGALCAQSRELVTKFGNLAGPRVIVRLSVPTEHHPGTDEHHCAARECW